MLSRVYEFLNILKSPVCVLLKYGDAFLEACIIHNLRVIPDLVRGDHANKRVGKRRSDKCVVPNRISGDSCERDPSTLSKSDRSRKQQDVSEGRKLCFLLQFEHEAFMLLWTASSNICSGGHRITFNSVRSMSDERM